MTIATREQLLKPAERRFCEIVLPVSGARVRIQSLREGEKSDYESEVQFCDDGKRREPAERMDLGRPALVCLVLVDEKGDCLLSPDDTDAVSEMDGKDVAAIYDVAWKHCGMADTDVDALLKNSATVQSS